MHTKVNNDVGCASIVATDGWSSLGHLQLHYRWIIMRISSLVKHIEEVLLSYYNIIILCLKWFYMKNLTISSHMRNKLVRNLIHNCPFWYGYWWYAQYISRIILKFWNIPILVCRRFGLSTFWLILLRIMQFMDICALLSCCVVVV